MLAFVAIGSFAVQTLSLGVYAWLSRARAAAWHDAIAGRATLADARHAHHELVLASRSTGVTVLLGAVCISLWSERVVTMPGREACESARDGHGGCGSSLCSESR